MHLVHADLLALAPDAFGGAVFSAVWDRGGLTSIHGDDVGEYLRALHGWLLPGGRLLLELLDVQGAPMGAGGASTALTEAGFAVSTLSTKDVRGEYPDHKGGRLEEVVLLGVKITEDGTATP